MNILLLANVKGCQDAQPTDRARIKPRPFTTTTKQTSDLYGWNSSNLPSTASKGNYFIWTKICFAFPQKNLFFSKNHETHQNPIFRKKLLTHRQTKKTQRSNFRWKKMADFVVRWSEICLLRRLVSEFWVRIQAVWLFIYPSPVTDHWSMSGWRDGATTKGQSEYSLNENMPN